MKSIDVYMVFFNFDVHPVEMAKTAGVAPDKFRVKGELTDSKRHRWKDNSFMVYSNLEESADLDLHIDAVRHKMSAITAPIPGLEIKLNIVIRLNGECSPKSATYISKPAIKWLSEIDCELDIDIYS